LGRLPKPPDRQQGHRPAIGLIPGGLLEEPRKREKAPAPSFGWLAETRDAWAEFWTSRSSDLVDRASDLTAVRHLFTLYDERSRAFAAYRRQRLVRGSKKQMVANPVYKVARAIQQEIRQLEQQFGIGERSRRALGIVGREPTLDEMNRALEADFSDPREDEAAPPARKRRRT
jgi:phage terminase small subunit